MHRSGESWPHPRPHDAACCAPSSGGGASVVKNPRPGEGNQAARDYLTRTDGVINLLYATPGSGGVSTDTLLASDTTRFIRSDVPEKKVPLYDKQGRHKADMSFVYGRVPGNGPGSADRFGWIAKDLLQQ